MAETQQNENELNKQAIKKALSELQINECILSGKVTEISTPQESQFTYFNVSLPAPDQYSSPQLIQVSQPATQRPFANVDEVVTLHVKQGGYGRRNNGNLYVTNTHNFLSRVA